MQPGPSRPNVYMWMPEHSVNAWGVSARSLSISTGALTSREGCMSVILGIPTATRRMNTAQH